MDFSLPEYLLSVLFQQVIVPVIQGQLEIVESEDQSPTIRIANEPHNSQLQRRQLGSFEAFFNLKSVYQFF